MSRTNYYYDPPESLNMVEEPGELCDGCGELGRIAKAGTLIPMPSDALAADSQWVMRVDYVEQARRDYPQGTLCGRCHGVNDNADDCGWFMWFGPGFELAVCQSCWNALGLTTAER